MLITYLTIINVVTFCLFGIDKSRARRDAWRISEKTLLGFSMIGGSLGGFAGMRFFHHKTRKPAFRIGVPCMLALHIVFLAFMDTL